MSAIGAWRSIVVTVAGALLCIIPITGAADDFVNFETGQVRPLALSPDGSRLFAINTPDNRLEIFAVDSGGLTHLGSVTVGLEPIAVAVRNASEVWVVNHLSDSVSVIDVASAPPRVTHTLLTCDEPRDIVFAGTDRAFVTTARRGQNCPVPPDLTTEGTGRAIVQVFDSTSLNATLGGTPIANIVLFGDTPRALTRSPDGNTVYAGVFHSGNQTTAITEGAVCNGGALAPPCVIGPFTAPGGLPAPNVNTENIPGPEVGLIVRFNPLSNLWEDSLGRNWTGGLKFDLPDFDVFAIDAAAPAPIETANFAHVGTVLFNMVTNPVSGKVYVSNTEARNEVRFEGPGLAFGSTTVQGHLHESRISVIDGSSVLPRHLNKHIDYDQRPAPPGVKEHSLATPLEMAVTADGSTLYVTAFGSNKIGIFSTAALESDTFVPDVADHIVVSGGGPTGIVLDEPRDRMYVFTRFDNGISTIDLTSETELAHQLLYSPEPTPVVAGRSVLYDAFLSSSNGEASCSSCHVFGDFDSLAWDLGNPDEPVLNNPIPVRIPAIGHPDDFHPLKGPMTTQSLRGMADHGSMHWRGDRTGGNDPGGDSFDEDAAFKKFNPAFPGLLGRDTEIPAATMQAFTDFILTVAYPPNPIRALDQELTGAQQNGRNLYFGPITDAVFNCNGCHTLNPEAGFFGSDGFSTFEGETQMFKVPHLRNVYQKVGMFGMPTDGTHLGPQVRGYGVLHDGSIDTVFRFLGASVFSLTNAEQRQLEQFVLAFDSNLAPVVGQQVTLSSASFATADARIGLLMQRDTVNEECEVVIKGTIGGEQRGAYVRADGNIQFDRITDPVLVDAQVRTLVFTPGQELTYTCVPPGSGLRMGVDRDLDGVFDRDEIDAGTNPADPEDFPGLINATSINANQLIIRDDDTPPIDPNLSRLKFRSANHKGVPSGVVVPTPGSAADPTTAGASGGGAVLTLYRADGGSGKVTLPLPAAYWTQFGTATKPGFQYRDSKRINGPITSVKIINGQLAIRGKSVGMYQLDGAPQNVMAVRLQLGSDVAFCTAVTPRAPASNNDTTSRFIGEPAYPGPVTCPVVP